MDCAMASAAPGRPIGRGAASRTLAEVRPLVSTVSRHVDLSRSEPDDRVVAELVATGEELDYQRSVGDVAD
jgi:hypothetical protein